MIDLDTVLVELADTEGIPTAATLDELIKRFPQFGQQITEFAIELATDPMRWGSAPEAPKGESRAGRAVSHFFNRLHSLQTSKVDLNAFSLDASALREVSLQLSVNTRFLSRVWAHAIDPETIPPPFASRLSKALRAPEPAVCAFLAQTMSVPQTMRHKTDGKPSVLSSRQSFDEAAVSSGLTSEQLSALKKPL